MFVWRVRTLRELLLFSRMNIYIFFIELEIRKLNVHQSYLKFLWTMLFFVFNYKHDKEALINSPLGPFYRHSIWLRTLTDVFDNW